MTDHIVRHIIVRGQVQGVGYRAFVERAAQQHGLAGWVRNRRDGSVEAVFAGPHAAVEAMIETSRRGPFSARVDDIIQREGSEADIKDAAGSFSVLPTV